MIEMIDNDGTVESIEWRQIIVKGIETNYEVSNTGLVRNAHTGRILKFWIDRDGYYRSTISINKELYHTGTHRFVAIAFIPNPNNLPEVNHKNGIKSDNRVENLEWVTTQQNIQHAFDTGLKSAIVGEDNSLSVYTEKQIRIVCFLLEKGIKNVKISEITGVNKKYITDIKKGRRWAHISREYDFTGSKSSNTIINQIDINKLNCASLNDYLLLESTFAS